MNRLEIKSLPPSGLVFVGAGSNVGERAETLKAASRRLAATPGVLSLTCSPIYETLPVGAVGPGRFFNAVFRLTVRLSPMALFRHLQSIEDALGRRPPRIGPRPIDLDLLFYDDLVLQSETLTIPHPRAHARSFVLRPLADLAPEFCHPELGQSVRELLEALDQPGEIVGCLTEDGSIEKHPLSI